MHATRLLLVGNVVLTDRILSGGAVLVEQGRIAAVGPRDEIEARLCRAADATECVTPLVDARDGYISPGYIDLHVHGGAGADFMDGDECAFETVLDAHLRHGTTSLTPTTTVARHDQIVRVLELCRRYRLEQSRSVEQCRRLGQSEAPPQREKLGLAPQPTSIAPTPPTSAASTAPFDPRPMVAPRVLGAHFYGPYFCYEARGCHPADSVRPPRRDEFDTYLAYSDSIATATIAPEVDGAAEFARACRDHGVRLNAGHSHATFDQMRAAVDWGVRHVDHLYCAMSDKTKLRQTRPFPMQGGVLEATLYFDELTTEVIADGKHLTADLLLLAHKIKGPDRLALVTDCNRALDMPEGTYLFGPADGGEPFVHRDGVGVMPDGKALASSTQGMDHMVRTFHAMTGVPLFEAVQMATLTPARIIGRDHELGSLDVGKHADVLVLSLDLKVERAFVGGREADLARRPGPLPLAARA